MAASTHYLAVLKAAYDYEPQSEDEIAIKEDQVLYLIERTDDDWWKVKAKGSDEENEGGLVPSAYVEPAEHKSVVKALYDYEASAPGELSVKEDDVLYAFDTEEEWLLVQTEKDGGQAGFIPVTYVEESNELGPAAAEEEAQEEEEEEEEEPAPNPIAGIIVPPSPPRPSAPYVDPAERVAASHAVSAAANDSIQTWAVSEVDKKGKKKKGTLGIGNGSIFFASESDKTPVQKWPTADVESSYIEKSKHVHIEILGANPINLHYNAGSKDTAEAIIDKLDSSKQIAKSQADADAAAEEPAIASTSSPKPKKNGVSVHFTSAPPSIISPREPEEMSEVGDYISASNTSQPDDGNEWATVLYDFSADGEDELTVAEGDRLIVLERDSDDWWKVRDGEGHEGVVPAQYVELDESTATGTSTATNGDAARAAAERERLEEEREREKEAERRAEAERKAQAAAAAEAAEAERRRREREREKRAREEADKRAREQQEAEQKRAARESRPDSSSGSRRRQSEEVASSSRGNKPRGSADGARAAPSPQRVRTWHDRTGQFQVDAEFLGMSNGKLRLHKTNGVVIEVPSEKMSAEDLKFIESVQYNGKSRDRNGDKARKPSRALSPGASDDDQPLAERRRSLQPEPKSKPAPPKKSMPIDWFEFFLNAGCDLDDCTRYASSFERDKMDESILPDITQETMRRLGLREGDIIRVSKHILQRVGSQGGGNSALEEQIRRDEDMARKLQDEENVGNAPKRQTASPGLFAGPGGVLKNNTRRGRPQPSKSTPPASVDLLSINTASEQITRERSPSVPLVASPTSAITAPAKATSTVPASGFDDDAWTNRPSSTQPAAPTPPVTTARTPSAPPAQTASVASPPPAIAVPAPAAPGDSTNKAGSNLARTTENDVFDQLARLASYKPKSPPAVSPSPINQQMSQLPISSPAIVSPPIGIQNGLGAGSSPVPVGQLQSQMTGYPQNIGPRGPFAPVPANQGLLQPLVPTTTGFNSFVPTRPSSNPPPSFSSPSPQPSFLNTQPTGFSGPLTAQPTGFPTSFNAQPTGFQGGLTAQPTGFPGAQAPQPTGFQPSGPPVQQTTSYPGAFGSGPFTGGRAFGPLQPNVTGYNAGFGQMSSPPPIPPVPPLPSNTNANNTSPANIFASMKSGTFGNDSAPQSSNKYDALRPQPTGWGATTGFQNGGYSGTFY